jgi:hypothetical protein
MSAGDLSPSKARLQLASQLRAETEMMDPQPNLLRAHWTRGTAWLLLAAVAFGIGCAHTVERNDWEAYQGLGRDYFLKEEVDVQADVMEALADLHADSEVSQ